MRNDVPPPQGDELVAFLAAARRGIDPKLRRANNTRQRRRRTFLGGGLAVVIVVGGGATVAANDWFETTPDGRTYGGVPSGTDFLDRGAPDLIAVLGDHGRQGYVSKELLAAPFNDVPTSPEDALADQLARKRNPAVLPVYAADGKTQIDTFTMGSHKPCAECNRYAELQKEP